MLGVVHLPALGATYAGGPAGRQPGGCRRSQRSRSSARAKPADGVIVLASRSHNVGDELDRYLEGHHVAERIAAGSSLKFCRLAEGLADLYPRFGRTMEWDTAAGHAVLAAAGGHVDDARRQAAASMASRVSKIRISSPAAIGQWQPQ